MLKDQTSQYDPKNFQYLYAHGKTFESIYFMMQKEVYNDNSSFTSAQKFSYVLQKSISCNQFLNVLLRKARKYYNDVSELNFFTGYESVSPLSFRSLSLPLVTRSHRWRKDGRSGPLIEAV